METEEEINKRKKMFTILLLCMVVAVIFSGTIMYKWGARDGVTATLNTINYNYDCVEITEGYPNVAKDELVEVVI